MYEALTTLRCKTSMDKKMKYLHKNIMWELVNPLSGKNLDGYWWIYIVKYKINSIIKCFKQDMIQKGYT